MKITLLILGLLMGTAAGAATECTATPKDPAQPAFTLRLEPLGPPARDFLQTVTPVRVSLHGFAGDAVFETEWVAATWNTRCHEEHRSTIALPGLGQLRFSRIWNDGCGWGNRASATFQPEEPGAAPYVLSCQAL